jgi:hypothetical protein
VRGEIAQGVEDLEDEREEAAAVVRLLRQTAADSSVCDMPWCTCHARQRAAQARLAEIAAAEKTR